MSQDEAISRTAMRLPRLVAAHNAHRLVPGVQERRGPEEVTLVLGSFGLNFSLAASHLQLFASEYRYDKRFTARNVEPLKTQRGGAGCGESAVFEIKNVGHVEHCEVLAAEARRRG